jgi:hypothetical protein
MSGACPSCGNPADELFPVDTGMRLALKTTGMADSLPDAVCSTCMAELAGKVSQGYKLRQEADARNKNRVLMWKNRVNLIKQARTLMANKSYSEAAVAYEKYIRILEVIYNLEKGQLSPAVFNNSSRSKEMSVIASTYWDLMRIYDTNPGYGERMQVAATKLAQFLPFSSLYPDIVKKAEQFARSAKNPQIVRQFLRSCKSTRGPCFIASAVIEDDPWAWELGVFRRFRDENLKASRLGRKFVFMYYRYSPLVAKRLRGSQWKKRLLKPILRKIATHLNKSLKSN